MVTGLILKAICGDHPFLRVTCNCHTLMIIYGDQVCFYKYIVITDIFLVVICHDQTHFDGYVS